jgi:hypothetical protein
MGATKRGLQMLTIAPNSRSAAIVAVEEYLRVSSSTLNYIQVGHRDGGSRKRQRSGYISPRFQLRCLQTLTPWSRAEVAIPEVRLK